MTHPLRGDALSREEIERTYGVFVASLLTRQRGTGGSLARYLLRNTAAGWAGYAENAQVEHSEQMLRGKICDTSIYTILRCQRELGHEGDCW
jgi:hypothetical protein